ncbi:MAG: hypothetical protein ACTSSD_19365, partial [Candidatus Thorarchaeota archaeon]
LPGRDWNDPQVRDSMAEVFEAHSELSESHPLSDEMKDLLKGIRQPAPPVAKSVPGPSQAVYVSKSPEADISEIVSSPIFTEEYLDRVRSANQGNSLPVARMLTVVASKFCGQEGDLIPFTERLLLHAAGVLQEPKETAVLSDILVAIKSESI